MDLTIKKGLLTLLLLIVGTYAISRIAYGVVSKEEPVDIDKQEQSVVQRLLGQANVEQPSDSYIKGQIIVKYKDTLTGSASDLHGGGHRFKDYTTDGSDSLDKLNNRHQVKKIRPLFRTEAKEKQLRASQGGLLPLKHSTLKAAWKDKVQSIKAKYPKRAARAPKDAKIPDLSHIYVLEVSEETNIETLVAEYASDPHVEYAQPSYLAKPYLVPPDPYFHSCNSWGQGCPADDPPGYDDLWGLKKLQVEQAWDVTQGLEPNGSPVVVAVVDTGLDADHPEIAENIWRNPGEIPGNGIDDDNNGYEDDVWGWDFGESDNDPSDFDGHGTHVSGTIAAATNTVGVVGVAPKTKIMMVKGFGGPLSGQPETMANAIKYAAENGADVINNSWGCIGRCPSHPAHEEAVIFAYGLGATVVFAAGNDTDDVAFYSPQNMDETITVSSMDHDDQLSDFSNYGLGVDVGAPGGESGFYEGGCYHAEAASILSLRADQKDMFQNYPCIAAREAVEPQWDADAQYYRALGTSMASPHVAGLSALILATKPELTNEDVHDILRLTADDVGPPGDDPESGSGRINAWQAVQMAQDFDPSDLPVFLHAGNVTFIEQPDEADRAFEPGETIEVMVSIINGRAPATAVVADLTTQEPLVSIAPSALPLGDFASSERKSATFSVSLDEQVAPGTVVDLQLNLVAVDFQGGTAISMTVEPPIRRITVNDEYHQQNPQISGEHIIWMDDRGADESSIYRYDLTTNTELGVGNDYYPLDYAISNDRFIYSELWLGEGTLHLYDIPSGADTVELEHSYPEGPYTQMAFDGNRVVWTDSRRWESDHKFDIYLYDMATHEYRRITPDEAYAKYPKISGDWVVWMDYRSGVRYDTYLGNVITGEERLLTTHPDSGGEHPDISGNRVVWLDWRHGLLDVYLYDLRDAPGTERRISGEVSCATEVAISGDLITWTEHGETCQGIPNEDLPDIYLYDLRTDTPTRLTVSSQAQGSPDVSGNRVVWDDERNGNSDIYMHEVAKPTGSGTPIDGTLLNMYDKVYVDRISRYVSFSSKSPEINVPDEGGAADPLIHGGSIEILNTSGTEESVVIPLPAENWQRTPQNPSSALRGWKYKEQVRNSAADNFKIFVLFKQNASGTQARLKIKLKDRGGNLIDYTLDESSQGSVGVRFHTGDDQHCADFGGTISTDQSIPLGDDRYSGRFRAKEAAAPDSCEL